MPVENPVPTNHLREIAKRDREEAERRASRLENIASTLDELELGDLIILEEPYARLFDPHFIHIGCFNGFVDYHGNRDWRIDLLDHVKIYASPAPHGVSQKFDLYDVDRNCYLKLVNEMPNAKKSMFESLYPNRIFESRPQVMNISSIVRVTDLPQTDEFLKKYGVCIKDYEEAISAPWPEHVWRE